MPEFSDRHERSEHDVFEAEKSLCSSRRIFFTIDDFGRISAQFATVSARTVSSSAAERDDQR